MKNQLVPFEIAQSLQKAGFDEVCKQQYGKDSHSLYNFGPIRNSDTENDGKYGVISAPTWKHAIEWATENKADTIKPLLHQALMNM